MQHERARQLIAHPLISGSRPEVWADLGCGDGTFTLALAALLPGGSTIHAMDREPTVLASLPHRHQDVGIHPHVGDFTSVPWPFPAVDGILMANSLHYVTDPLDFLRRALGAPRRPRLLLVEYDTERANRWVPYPLSQARARRMLAEAGLKVTPLGTTASVYRDADIYALLAEAPERVTPAHDRLVGGASVEPAE